jgi:hypothetical protein
MDRIAPDDSFTQSGSGAPDFSPVYGNLSREKVFDGCNQNGCPDEKTYQEILFVHSMTSLSNSSNLR